MSTSSKDTLALYGGTPSLAISGPHYRWPRITENLQAAIASQLRKDISIMDRSGIFEEFEELFRGYHTRRYALVCNSGTSALHAMYVGANLGPGDEVIVPVYTFHATVTPLLHTGATPIFCDCGSDGSIDESLIEKLITKKTKAITVTHMFGLPCNMDEIVRIADKHGLMLFEDCSHAHGAKYKGRPVGSFGTAAVWSFQGQKIITGGEGGILVTNSSEIYVKAQLLGHYNKRCKQEIPAEHPLYPLATTGFGLKLRAHPVAMAMAMEQFTQVDEFRIKRTQYARKFAYALHPYAFIQMPQLWYEEREPTWYFVAVSFDAKTATISRELFIKALQAEGLKEIDGYDHLAPLYRLPLFKLTDPVGPIRSPSSLSTGVRFDGADRFCQTLVKIPAWTFDDEAPLVEQYIRGLVKVCDAIKSGLLKE